MSAGPTIQDDLARVHKALEKTRNQLATGNREIDRMSEQLEAMAEGLRARISALRESFAVSSEAAAPRKERFTQEMTIPSDILHHADMLHKLTAMEGWKEWELGHVADRALVFRLQRDLAEMKKATRTLIHYVKKARAGDSPIIHKEIVLAVDDAVITCESIIGE